MSSGFSTTGVNDGAAQTDQTECGGLAEVILSAIEQRHVGGGVLSARRDQRELFPKLAGEVEGCRGRRTGVSRSGVGDADGGAVYRLGRSSVRRSTV